jgi:hypothetical protein
VKDLNSYSNRLIFVAHKTDRAPYVWFFKKNQGRLMEAGRIWCDFPARSARHARNPAESETDTPGRSVSETLRRILPDVNHYQKHTGARSECLLFAHLKFAIPWNLNIQ